MTCKQRRYETRAVFIAQQQQQRHCGMTTTGHTSANNISQSRDIFHQSRDPGQCRSAPEIRHVTQHPSTHKTVSITLHGTHTSLGDVMAAAAEAEITAVQGASVPESPLAPPSSSPGSSHGTVATTPTSRTADRSRRHCAPRGCRPASTPASARRDSASTTPVSRASAGDRTPVCGRLAAPRSSYSRTHSALDSSPPCYTT